MSAAKRRRLTFDAAPERAAELLAIRLEVLDPFLAFLDGNEGETIRIASKRPPGALDVIDPAVGSRRRNIVLQQDRSAARGLDQRRIDVAHHEDRKRFGEGHSVSVRVDLGGSGNIQKKKK